MLHPPPRSCRCAGWRVPYQRLALCRVESASGAVAASCDAITLLSSVLLHLHQAAEAGLTVVYVLVGVCPCILQVTDAGGERLNFARGRWLDLDGGIVAAPPAVHAAVLAAVKSVRSSQAKA